MTTNMIRTVHTLLAKTTFSAEMQTNIS